MGVVGVAGYCVVEKSGAVVAIMRTRKAARRRLKQERARRPDVYLAEMYFSDGLLEGSE